jgi:serine phosphatase RsbU (regulator of sigma subunit)
VERSVVGAGIAAGDTLSAPVTDPRPSRAHGLRGPRWVVVVVGLVGLVVTVSASLSAWRIDRSNERRLLRVQTTQAAEVVASAIVGIQSPLETALDVASATDGNAAQFARFMSTYTTSTGLFVTASLWQTGGAAPVLIASVGAPAVLQPVSANAREFMVRVARASTFVVTNVSSGAEQRVGYGLAGPKGATYAVYVERAIPANRRVAVESNSAFADLYYATYLGSSTSTANLETTDVALSHLPLSGTTARATIPFGDTTITLVTAPIGHLGGAFGAQLPWIFLVGGLLLTLAAALVAGEVVRRGTAAEVDAQTIRGLYGRLDHLYGQQRTIAETLQRALIPHTNPSIPNLEIASRYVAGARGVDIGGDWYSVIQIDNDHFGFVVGDVSGRGVEAAAIMARIRFTLRAYLFEGHSPAAALQLCSRQLDINTDGHIVTVLVGLGNHLTGELILANAGHLNPLLVFEGRSTFIGTQVGLPLGFSESSYSSTEVSMQADSVFVAFTDGLVERRGEDLDLGLRRLGEVAGAADGDVDRMLETILTTMTGDGAEDDTAMLAFRWSAAT